MRTIGTDSWHLFCKDFCNKSQENNFELVTHGFHSNMQSNINSDTFKKKNQSRYIRKETGRNVALYRRMIQTVTMNQFFGECFDLEKKPWNDEVSSTNWLEDSTACYVHYVHAVVITTPPYPALLDTTHCANTHAKTGMLMIKVALSVTEFQPHWEN